MSNLVPNGVTACKDERSRVVWDLDSTKEVARLYISSPIVKMVIAGNRLIVVYNAWLLHVMELA